MEDLELGVASKEFREGKMFKGEKPLPMTQSKLIDLNNIFYNLLQSTLKETFFLRLLVNYQKQLNN